MLTNLPPTPNPLLFCSHLLKEGSGVSLSPTLPPMGKRQVGEGSRPSSNQFIVNQALTLNFSLVPQPTFCSFV